MSIVDWMRRLLNGSQTASAERRQHARYALAAGLEVVAAGQATACRIDNVSAGGVRVVPAVDVPVGSLVAVRDPATGMSLDGVVLGHEAAGTRVMFESADAGIIVSTWLRTTAEESA